MSDADAPRRKGAILATAATILAVIAACGLSVAYYRYPPFAARELARMTGKAGFLPPPHTSEALVERSNWPQKASVIPATVIAPLTESNEILRIDELRQRPNLLIEGATLAFDAGSRARIATPKLTLRNSTLVTNGADIEIEVETLVVENSEIRAFTLTDTAPAQGPGRDAGHVRLVVHGRLSGVLRVDLGAQAGAAGAPGKSGQPGAAGAKGADARASGETCLARAGAGAAGAPGGRGGDGGDGARGGEGGELTLLARNPADAVAHIEFSAEAGRGGAPGAAGAGGEGGPGGLGGAPAGLCIGDGPQGGRGPNGQPGSAGAAGETGKGGAMRTLGLGETR